MGIKAFEQYPWNRKKTAERLVLELKDKIKKNLIPAPLKSQRSFQQAKKTQSLPVET
jgi:Holliday junction resolvasome RuvABC DNA-binding subunit